MHYNYSIKGIQRVQMFGILLHDERSLGFSSIHLFLLAKKKWKFHKQLARKQLARPYAIADKIEIDVSNLERVFEKSQ